MRDTYTRGERQRANNILKRMREIPQNEMMIQECYVTGEVINSKLAKSGAICQGHQACAIGSLMLAGRQPIQFSSWTDQNGVKHTEWGDILGSTDAERRFIFRNDGGLELAYRALEEAADRYAEEHDDVDPHYHTFTSRLEALFEGEWPFNTYSTAGRKKLNHEMIKVIDAAREIARSGLREVDTQAAA